MQTTTKRTNVTVDDRRAVMPMLRGRKPADIAAVPNEAFIRRALKARLGYAKDEAAPQSVKDAAKQMAAVLQVQAEAALAAFKAKHTAVVIDIKTGEVR